MTIKKTTGKIGSSFADFLKEEGLYDDATTHAVKAALAWQIEQGMQKQNLTKTTMAKRMKTSRSQLDRLLDPENDQVSLGVIQRAAGAIGMRLNISLKAVRA
jgi:antitoxin HicB